MRVNRKSLLLLLGIVAAIVGWNYVSTVHGGPKAKECLKVVDQNGKPVQGAKIRGGFVTGDGLDDYTPVDGFTDAKGRFTAKGRTIRQLSLQITKKGYYGTRTAIEYKREDDGRWEPYGETRTVVLNEICQLGGLCVRPEKRRFGWKIPCRGQWIGFDLEKFDWVAPYGEGRENDFLARYTAQIKSRFSDYRETLEISFTNNPYAGFYQGLKNMDSDLQWPYAADTNKEFQTSMFFLCEKRPGMVGNRIFLSDIAYLVFRTRTKVDEKGRLISAHYGMISGVWQFGGDEMRMGDACFNPVPNDLRLEDGFHLRESVRHANEK